MRLPDLWLFLPAFLLSSLALLVIYSIDPEEFLSQALFLGLGIIVFALISLVDFSLLEVLAPFFYSVVIIVLAAILVLGENIRGSRRWFSFGGFHVQASELAKPFFILFLSFLSTRCDLKRFSNFCLVLLAIATPVGLIFLEPDLGSTIAVGLIGVYVLLTMRPAVRFVVPLVLLFLLCIPLGWKVMAPYQKDRVEHFLNPAADPLGASYNQVQATIAVGSGQIFGKGLGRGTQSHLQFLPEKHTDFFFASSTEELGFVGSATIIFLFIFLSARLINLTSKATQSSHKIVFIGTYAMIFFQAFIHIGINIGILPVTGLTLPFMSAGGSSMLVNWLALGIASSASHEIKENRAIFLR